MRRQSAVQIEGMPQSHVASNYRVYACTDAYTADSDRQSAAPTERRQRTNDTRRNMKHRGHKTALPWASRQKCAKQTQNKSSEVKMQRLRSLIAFAIISNFKVPVPFFIWYGHGVPRSAMN